MSRFPPETCHVPTTVLRPNQLTPRRRADLEPFLVEFAPLLDALSLTASRSPPIAGCPHTAQPALFELAAGEASNVISLADASRLVQSASMPQLGMVRHDGMERHDTKGSAPQRFYRSPSGAGIVRGAWERQTDLAGALETSPTLQVPAAAIAASESPVGRLPLRIRRSPGHLSSALSPSDGRGVPRSASSTACLSRGALQQSANGYRPARQAPRARPMTTPESLAMDPLALLALVDEDLRAGGSDPSSFPPLALPAAGQAPPARPPFALSRPTADVDPDALLALIAEDLKPKHFAPGPSTRISPQRVPARAPLSPPPSPPRTPPRAHLAPSSPLCFPHADFTPSFTPPRDGAMPLRDGAQPLAAHWWPGAPDAHQLSAALEAITDTLEVVPFSNLPKPVGSGDAHQNCQVRSAQLGHSAVPNGSCAQSPTAHSAAETVETLRCLSWLTPHALVVCRPLPLHLLPLSHAPSFALLPLPPPFTRRVRSCQLCVRRPNSHRVPLGAARTRSCFLDSKAEGHRVMESTTTYYSLLTTYYLLLTTYRATESTTTYYLLLTTHHSLPTTHYSLLTTHHLLLIAHSSLPTAHYSLLTLNSQLITTHYSQLTAYYSLLANHYALSTTHYSRLTPQSALPTPHCPLLAPHSPLLIPNLSLLIIHLS